MTENITFQQLADGNNCSCTLPGRKTTSKLSLGRCFSNFELCFYEDKNELLFLLVFSDGVLMKIKPTWNNFVKLN